MLFYVNTNTSVTVKLTKLWKDYWLICLHINKSMDILRYVLSIFRQIELVLTVFNDVSQASTCTQSEKGFS